MPNGERLWNSAGPAGAASPDATVWRSDSAQETERLGERLAPHLEAGDVVALMGPLGAGKTRFVSGLARGMGLAPQVRSPSYTLLHEYPGRLPLFHADLYRLETHDVGTLGLEEVLELGALVVEWAERLPEASLERALHVTFEILSDRARRLTVRALRPRARALLEAWCGAR